MLVVSSKTAVGWNKRTKFYHRIKYSQYIVVAFCESGTLLDNAGTPEESEREPCKKCFRAGSQ